MCLNLYFGCIRGRQGDAGGFPRTLSIWSGPGSITPRNQISRSGGIPHFDMYGHLSGNMFEDVKLQIFQDTFSIANVISINSTNPKFKISNTYGLLPLNSLTTRCKNWNWRDYWAVENCTIAESSCWQKAYAQKAGRTCAKAFHICVNNGLRNPYWSCGGSKMEHALRTDLYCTIVMDRRAHVGAVL